MTPKFPDVHVQLSGRDGNAFFIIGRTRTALKDGGATPEQVQEYVDAAESGDYDNVLQTTMKWVSTS